MQDLSRPSYNVFPTGWVIMQLINMIVKLLLKVTLCIHIQLLVLNLFESTFKWYSTSVWSEYMRLVMEFKIDAQMCVLID